MPIIYLLDSGPLGLLAYSKPSNRIALEAWLMNEVAAGAKIWISEVADHEVRRELVRLIQSGKIPANRIDRLDLLQTLFQYLSVTTAMWRRASEFWAKARCQGLPAASSAALDGDVLIASQAAEISATVVTTNAAHIGVWAPVKQWP